MSGFYDNEFDLTLSAPEGTKIYYTVDSSDPTAESTEYTEAIKVLNPKNIEKEETPVETPEDKKTAAKKPMGGFNPFTPQGSNISRNTMICGHG